MTFNKIFVLGAGAIGSIYGALLSKKFDVVLFGEKRHIEKIKQRGLEVYIGRKKRVIKLKAKEKIQKIPPKTLILLSTKAHQTEKALKEIKGKLRKDTLILILQNGLGNKALVKKIVGKKIRVERAIVYTASEFLEPGKIRSWPKKTLLPKNEISKEIKKAFQSCGLEVELSKNFKKEVWEKLIINSVLGPLAALFKIRNNQVADNRLKKVREMLIEECLRVAEAEGVKIEKNFKGDFERKISKYTNYPSMCQDIIKGQKTEIDFLNGKIIELAKKHGIDVPANEIVYSLIKFLQKN